MFIQDSNTHPRVAGITQIKVVKSIEEDKSTPSKVRRVWANDTWKHG